MGTTTVREGMPSTPRGAAGVCPPQQVPGAMATAGISQPGGRKQPQPGFGLRSPNCSRPRGSKDGREGTPRLGLHSLGTPGIHSVSGAVCVRSPRSGCNQGGGSSAQRCLLPGPRWRRAERRSAAQPVPSRPPPFGRWRKPACSAAAAGAGRMLWAALVAGIQRPAPALRPRGFC